MDIITLTLAKKYAEQLAMGNIDTEAIITAEVEKAVANLELLKQEDIDNAIAAIEIPSINGLASTEYVDNSIANAGYAKPDDITTSITELKKDKVFEILGENPNSFAIKVNAADNKTLYQAMAEKGSGLYTVYVQKGVEDNPAGSTSSCRGICNVNTWYNLKEFYGWIILFDSYGNCYTRYISVSDGPSEWNNVKQQDLSAYATKEYVNETIANLKQELETYIDQKLENNTPSVSTTTSILGEATIGDMIIGGE